MHIIHTNYMSSLGFLSLCLSILIVSKSGPLLGVSGGSSSFPCSHSILHFNAPFSLTLVPSYFSMFHLLFFFILLSLKVLFISIPFLIYITYIPFLCFALFCFVLSRMLFRFLNWAHYLCHMCHYLRQFCNRMRCLLTILSSIVWIICDLSLSNQKCLW